MPPPSTSVPPPDDRLTITCLHCEKQQEVGRKAMSITCKFCSKPLKLEDIPIKDYQARRVIETVGVVTVEKKGSAIANLNVGGLIVRGKVKGNVKSRGPVFVGPEAEIKGDIVAPAIAVGAGAILEGKYEIGKLPEGFAPLG
jgi:hypothetical protein